MASGCNDDDDVTCNFDDVNDVDGDDNDDVNEDEDCTKEDERIRSESNSYVSMSDAVHRNRNTPLVEANRDEDAFRSKPNCRCSKPELSTRVGYTTS